MQKFAFIFIGKSGSGKGTQAKLLQDYFLQKGVELEHHTTGGEFRDFIQKDNYISSLTKDLNTRGILFPEFLAVYNWTNIFIKNLKENTNFILDGAPRRLEEAKMLHTAFNFLKYEKKIVVYFDLSDTEAKNRLMSRKRDDDTEENIDRRIDWFSVDVLPVVEYLKSSAGYNFIHLNAEKSIEDIFADFKRELEKFI